MFKALFSNATLKELFENTNASFALPFVPTSMYKNL